MSNTYGAKVIGPTLVRMETEGVGIDFEDWRDLLHDGLKQEPDDAAALLRYAQDDIDEFHRYLAMVVLGDIVYEPAMPFAVELLRTEDDVDRGFDLVALVAGVTGIIDRDAYIAQGTNPQVYQQERAKIVQLWDATEGSQQQPPPAAPQQTATPEPEPAKPSFWDKLKNMLG
ncbi:hypothetical protein [Ornithinimicrobium sp. INDO-MA30-4]|uniref:hypothetical protein n=1 Tax=Ornithinimicrobium sp. INDO-MA30-4 TaxID=2908651 RepID=UPI001F3ACA81|nr:hypothetical protein [Ornithinimicrobium sp. INDO-MA30-4]UJH70343.1 hypothetical protein L0A91_14595 [Ornithinimicrobium sp. INDO-MA30-4]